MRIPAMLRNLHMHKVPSLLTVVLVGGGLAGCTFARIYATSGNTVALTALNQQRAESSFTIHKHIAFDYTGSLDIQELVRTKVGTGATVQNVTVKVKQTVGDFFLNLITLGFASSKTFEVTGDVTRSH